MRTGIQVGKPRKLGGLATKAEMNQPKLLAAN
jgi:hypothetical protein